MKHFTCCLLLLLTVISYAMAKDPPKPEFPESEQFHLIGTFNGNTYYISTYDVTWSEAVAACEQNNGHLVTISSQEENDYIANEIRQVSDLAAINYPFHVFIGMSDADQEGTWRWMNGEPMFYTNWSPNEPNNLGDEDCAMMFLYTDERFGKWNDCLPTVTGRFVLEIEAESDDSSPVPGFTELGFFNGHTYYISNQPLPWMEANTACSLRGGYLATITSMEENDFIANAASQVTPDPQIQNPSYVFFGMTDMDSEGVWRWVTGEPWTFSRWNIGEPSNANLIGENVGMMYLTRDQRFSRWNDTPHTDRFRFFMEVDTNVHDLYR